jgi:hypothetical protein
LSEEEDAGAAGALGVDAGVVEGGAPAASLFDDPESLEALIDLPESPLLSLEPADGLALP